MRVTIKNYRGVSSAELDLSKICLLAGTNEAGKTSTAQAVAAALTGEPVPIVGVKKSSAGMLVRSGTASGSVELQSDTGKTLVSWPSAKVKTEGQAPYASPFAAGMSSIVTMDEKERIQVLTEYMKATPTKADLESSINTLNLPAQIIDQLWERIESQGWDATHASVKEKGAKLKGHWDEITGEKYGSKKADSFIPEGWEPDLMGQAETTLQAQVTDARDALEAAIASEAVDDSKRADLEACAELLEQRTAEYESLKKVKDDTYSNQLQEVQGLVDEFTAKIDAIKAVMRGLPQLDTTVTTPCPSCGVALEVSGQRLTVATVLSDEEKRSRQAAIDAEQAKIVDLQQAQSKHMATIAKLKTQISESDADQAQRVLEAKRLMDESARATKELQGMAVAAAGPAGGVEQCRTTLSLAESRLKAFKTKYDADRVHASIQINQDLIDKIAADGVRGDVLNKAMKSFNDACAGISKAAGWRTVALEPNFLPTYGGTEYLLLSESAKFRVRVALQLTMARMDRSELVIVDAADILDKGGRNGLFKALGYAGIRALVCMTIDAKAMVPDLAKAGVGVSYWLNDSVAEVVA